MCKILKCITHSNFILKIIKRHYNLKKHLKSLSYSSIISYLKVKRERKLKAETTSFSNINLLLTLFGEKLKLVLST